MKESITEDSARSASESQEKAAFNVWKQVAKDYREALAADLEAAAGKLVQKNGEPLKLNIRLTTEDPIFLYRSINSELRKLKNDPDVEDAVKVEVNRVVSDNRFYQQFLDAKREYVRATEGLPWFEYEERDA